MINEFKIRLEFNLTDKSNKSGHVNFLGLLNLINTSVVFGCLPMIDKCNGVRFS